MSLSKLKLTKIIDTYVVYRGRGEGLNHGPSVTGPSRAQFLLPKPLLDKMIGVYDA